DRHLRIMPRKAADQRGHGRALPARINDQHNRPTGQPRQSRGRAGLAIGTGAVEQAHDAFAQHKLGVALQIRDEPGERRAARRPAAMSRAAIAPSWRNPIYSTMTGEPRAIASQSIPFGTAPPLLCPVTKVTAELMSRCVTGIPA